MKYFPKEAYLIKLLDHLKSIDTNVYIRFFLKMSSTETLDYFKIIEINAMIRVIERNKI